MSELAQLSAQEISLLSDYIGQLKLEQDALKRAEATALPEISERKVKLVERLNELEYTRSQLLSSPNGENMRAAMTRWLAKNPSDKAAAVNWEKVIDLARQAKQLHDLNGQLIKLHLQQTGELLAALTRQSQQSALYGSDGQAWQRTGSRIVDSA